jgi:hypothetical protein
MLRVCSLGLCVWPHIVERADRLSRQISNFIVDFQICTSIAWDAEPLVWGHVIMFKKNLGMHRSFGSVRELKTIPIVIVIRLSTFIGSFCIQRFINRGVMSPDFVSSPAVRIRVLCYLPPTPARQPQNNSSSVW